MAFDCAQAERAEGKTDGTLVRGNAPRQPLHRTYPKASVVASVAKQSRFPNDAPDGFATLAMSDLMRHSPHRTTGNVTKLSSGPPTVTVCVAFT